MDNFRTAEWARRGHPDRMCDIIADALLDEFLKQDKDSRVAIEVFGCHGIITVGGEVTSKAYVDIRKVVKDVYNEIGYKDNIGVQINIVEQSPEINQKAELGAGDSGITMGFATNETKEMLPLEVVLAKNISNTMDELIGDKYRIMPDGKIQVTLKNNKILKLVISYQINSEHMNFAGCVIKRTMMRKFSKYIDSNTNVTLIPFRVGGFDADTGLTGRKLILPYGPNVPIGGGNFSGKDPSKVDRSGAYYARYLAMQFVKEEQLSILPPINKCLVEIAWVIGKPEPLYVKINEEVLDTKDCTTAVSDVIGHFKLQKPIYKKTSWDGHFGSDFSWEK